MNEMIRTFKMLRITKFTSSLPGNTNPWPASSSTPSNSPTFILVETRHSSTEPSSRGSAGVPGYSSTQLTPIVNPITTTFFSPAKTSDILDDWQDDDTPVKGRDLRDARARCVPCGKALEGTRAQTWGNLKRHLDSTGRHTAGKSFGCRECRSRLARSDNLQAHMRNIHLRGGPEA